MLECNEPCVYHAFVIYALMCSPSHLQVLRLPEDAIGMLDSRNIDNAVKVAQNCVREGGTSPLPDDYTYTIFTSQDSTPVVGAHKAINLQLRCTL